MAEGSGKMSRRRFLALAGGAVGAAALACCGATALGLQQPRVTFDEPSYGGSLAGARVLVAYASRCGSTGEVAAVVGEILSVGGMPVDVRLAKNVTDVSDYQAVVVGSAIRFGSPLPEAMKFLEAHREALSQMPVAYFSLGTAMQEDTEENRREASAFLDKMRAVVQPVDVGLFGGVMDASKLAPILQPMTQVMDIAEEDFRDWDAIRAWAEGLRISLAV